jgi:cytochrome oxidase assembly protein ShyY1
VPPFLTKPRWIIGHVLVLAIVVACINLGFWQLRRLHQRKEHNAVVLARGARTTPLPDAGWTPGDHEDLTFRRVTVHGVYDAGHEVLVRFRSRLGLPGYEVVTPLLTDRGAVLVDRGWVPLDLGDRWPAPEATAPAGELDVHGLLAPEESGGQRLERTAKGQTVVGSIKVPELRRTLPYSELYGLHLLAEGNPAGYPAPVEPPDLSEGPHFSYAVQWFSFATVGIVGWVLLCATRGRERIVPEEPA